MEISIKSGAPEKQRTACVAVAVFEPRRLSESAKSIDGASGGYLSSLLRRGDLEGTLGQTLILHCVPNILPDRVLLVGCGREREFGDRQYCKAVQVATQVLDDMGAMEAVSYLAEAHVKGRNTYWKIRLAVETQHSALYRFDQLKTKKSQVRRPLRKIIYSTPRRDLNLSEQAVREAQSIARGMKVAKDLANLPGNLCTPAYLAEYAHSLCAQFSELRCHVLSAEDMAELRMGAILAVARGSEQPPQFIELTYQGAPVVLIGKGVTFDSGGISLKNPPNMDEMKYDMSGAAAVMGVMAAVAELRLPLHLIGLMPCAENMPGGRALKPGDVITSMSGQTIEIINTDAEGRLLMADALTYAERFAPSAVIDIATLTGAVITALGAHPHGLFGNQPQLLQRLILAGKLSDDRVWELPLWDEYQELIDSNVADMKNATGNRDAGAITAACFLARFVRNYAWAHLDIAGTAWKSGKDKTATGRPVPLIMQYLLDSLIEPPAGVNA